MKPNNANLAKKKKKIEVSLNIQTGLVDEKIYQSLVRRDG